MPNLVTTAITELATCLCAQLLADDLPPVCFCGVLPGDQVALDYAGDCGGACGMAWVRLVSSYPSSTIGQPSLIPGNCSSGVGIDVEMGVMRCVEVGEEDGQPVNPALLTAAAMLQYDDMLTMWRAVACCRQSKDWMIGQYAPTGPQGGLVGGIVVVSMLVT